MITPSHSRSLQALGNREGEVQQAEAAVGEAEKALAEVGTAVCT